MPKVYSDKLTNALAAALFALILSIAVHAAANPPVPAQTPPLPPVSLQPVLSGLAAPVFITNAKDGTSRLFIVQQGGIIKVLQPGAAAAADFLNVSSVISTGGERGLLGLTFHPNYRSNRRFFVYYTRAGDGAIQIAEYLVSTNNPNVAETSGRIIITIPHPDFDNHNGGTIEFGPDGFLYAGTGDGGAGNDPRNNAQNINNLLGKMIRINVDQPSGSVPYSIPADNPFVNRDGADEIYATGLRNPYRFSFDRGGQRQLYAGDVGQGALEEIDIVTRGGNYGWRVYEGNQCTGLDAQFCTPTNYVAPITQYGRDGGRCSVTGGYVYRGRGIDAGGAPYIYGDFCTGEIFALRQANSTEFSVLLDTNRRITSFGEDEAGEIYMAGIGGTVEKIIGSAASSPRAPVGGRIADARGRVLSRVVVTLTDVVTGAQRVALANSFGYYRFLNVDTGRTYKITVTHKTRAFTEQTFLLNRSLDNVNFAGLN